MGKIVKTEGQRVTDWLLYEADGVGNYSRDNVIVAPGLKLTTGTVVSLDSATGQVGEYKSGAPVQGILITSVDTTDGSPQTAAVVSRQARVSLSHIIWPAALSDVDKKAAIDDLYGHGVIPVPEKAATVTVSKSVQPTSPATAAPGAKAIA